MVFLFVFDNFNFILLRLTARIYLFSILINLVMKKFLINILFFSFITIICSEIYIRVNHLTIDIPRRTIDENGIQKYVPLQNGYWSNGTHSWQINKEGWAGELPSSFDNMVTLIGDSHIENFMNPDSCHLGAILNRSNLKYNFFEAGRSGVTLIEAFEISKELKKKYNPTKQFLFIKNSDFNESIVEFNRMNDVTQLDLSKNVVIKGELKSPFLKTILYNFKTLYYFRNTFTKRNEKTVVPIKKTNNLNDVEKKYYDKLMAFVSENYYTKDIVIFLHPNTDEYFKRLLIKYNFNFYQFKTKKTNDWAYAHNDLSHWNCYGFHQAAKQVSVFLKSIPLNKK